MAVFITLYTESRDGAATPRAMAINVDRIVLIVSRGASVTVRLSDGGSEAFSSSLEQVLALIKKAGAA